MTKRGSENRDGETRLQCLWRRMTDRLIAWRADWLDVIDNGPAEPMPTFDDPGFTDEQIFEALTVALLSGNTRWDRVARIRGELRTPFDDFEPQYYARLEDGDIGKIVSWFRERKAGSAGLGAGLLRLRKTAALLTAYDGGANAFFRDAFEAAGRSPEDLAVALGTSDKWKLPGFGIPLAAEALRNLGLDICKPDRHILRAIGSWSLINFSRWDRCGAFIAPQANPAELRHAMFVVRSIAEAHGLPVRYVNSAIWTAGAVSGARLTNDAFAEIARGCPSS